MLGKISSAVSVIALITFNVSAVISQIATIPLAAQVRDRQEVIADLTVLEKLMVDAETGQRGYALTGSPEFLEPYNWAKTLVPNYLSRIKNAPDYSQISRLAIAKLNHTESVVRLSSAQAQKVIATRKGKQIMDALRREIAKAIRGEQDKLEIARNQYLVVKNAALILLVGAVCADIGAIVFIRWRSKDVRQQAIELRRLVEEKTRELVEVNQNLQEAYRVKSQFISTLSHECRTPLTQIQLVAELMKTQEFAPSKRNRWVQQIEKAVSSIMVLLERVLTLESQPPCNPTPINLNQFIIGVIDEQINVSRASGDAQANRVRYFCHDSNFNLVGLFDETALKAILGNLINNALKYSKDVVVVRLLSISKTAIIEVRDRGIGIPQEDISRLFTDFSRGSNTGDIPGTGLGLAIAQRAVQRCGGAITVKSKKDEGSTFRVELPLE